MIKNPRPPVRALYLQRRSRVLHQDKEIQVYSTEEGDEDFSLTVTATTTEISTGEEVEVSTSLDVQVSSVADVPVVTIENAQGREDSWIQLNIDGQLTDLDGSESLSFVFLLSRVRDLKCLGKNQ